MADTYANYAELAANHVEGTDYQIIVVDIGSDTSCMTPHGGGIEVGTSEILTEVAGDKYNQYKFEGLLSSSNRVLHITSKNFDEPRALTMSAKSKRVVSFHGASGEEEITYVGGLDKTLCQSVYYHLRKAGFTVETAGSDIAGINPDNYMNKNIRGMGCQLELTTQQRKAFFQNYDWSKENRKNKSEAFYKYANALKEALAAVTERRVDNNTTVKMHFYENYKNGKGNVGETYVTGSKLTQTAESITGEVSKTYATKIQLDNIKIGGENLLRYTDYSQEGADTHYSCNYEGTLDIVKYTFGENLDTDKFMRNSYVLRNSQDIATAIANGNTYSRTKWKSDIVLEPNTEYTLSMYLFKGVGCGEVYFSVYPELSDGTSGTRVCNSDSITTYTGGFEKLSKTFNTGSASTSFSVRVYNKYDTKLTTGTSEIFIFHPMLEKGNKASDWTQSSRDMATTVALNSKIEQKADSIMSTVSANYSSKADLDNLYIGTNNLISNSGPYDLNGWNASDGWELSLVECANAPYGYAVRSTNLTAANGGLYTYPYNTLDQIIDGEVYTISAWIRASKACRLSLRNYMQDTRDTYIDVSTEWQYCTLTGRIDKSSTYVTHSIFVSTATCEANMWIEAHSFKFERGNKASDWSCAKADLEESISKVEQTANKINWLVKSGTSMSNMTLTDKLYSLVSNKVLIDARKIELNGSININDGLYTVFTNGNTKIGGQTPYTIEGYQRARFEITSEGTLFSTSHLQDQCFTKISEGYIKCNSADGSFTTIDGTDVRSYTVSTNTVQPRTSNRLTLTDGDSCTVELRTFEYNPYFRPSNNGSVRLGSSSYKWNSIWTTATSLNSTSDIRFKKDITPINEKIENMFMDLEPVNYRKKMHDDGRLHNGFIAQQVEEAMTKNNVSYDEFSGLVKTDIEAGSDLMLVSDETIYDKNDKEYSLAYGEFTALNTHMIQKLFKKIEELELRIKELEDIIDENDTSPKV